MSLFEDAGDLFEAAFGLVVLGFLIYTFAAATYGLGILSSLGFIAQCILAAREGELNEETVVGLGIGSFISYFLGSIANQAFQSLLSGAFVTFLSLVFAYLVVREMSKGA